jgi:hypothetical protein
VQLLTVDELFAFLFGEKYTTLPEPPTALPSPGIWIWASLNPERCGAAAFLFDCSDRPPAIYIAAALDVWAALKELETCGGVC